MHLWRIAARKDNQVIDFDVESWVGDRHGARDWLPWKGCSNKRGSRCQSASGESGSRADQRRAAINGIRTCHSCKSLDENGACFSDTVTIEEGVLCADVAQPEAPEYQVVCGALWLGSGGDRCSVQWGDEGRGGEGWGLWCGGGGGGAGRVSTAAATGNSNKCSRSRICAGTVMASRPTNSEQDPAVPHVAVTVANDHFYEGASQVLAAIRPNWPPGDITYKVGRRRRRCRANDAMRRMRLSALRPTCSCLFATCDWRASSSSQLHKYLQLTT